MSHWAGHSRPIWSTVGVFKQKVSKISRKPLKMPPSWDLPEGPVVKTSFSNAGGAGSISGQGAKITYTWRPKTKMWNRNNFVINSIKTFKKWFTSKKSLKTNTPFFLLQWTVASFAVHCDLICLIILDHLGTRSWRGPSSYFAYILTVLCITDQKFNNTSIHESSFKAFSKNILKSA